MANKTLLSLKEQVNFFLANSEDHETEARKVAASLFEGTALASKGYKGFRYLRLDEVNGAIPGIRDIDFNNLDESGNVQNSEHLFKDCDQSRRAYY